MAETELPRAGWKAVFALLAAAAVVLAYRVPLGDVGKSLIPGFRGVRSGGSVSIEVLGGPGRVRPTRWKFPDVPAEQAQPHVRVVKKPKRRVSIPEPSVASFVLSGRVFDLWTLEPVDGATLIFHSPEGDRYMATMSVSNGDYRAELPLKERDGFLLKVRHSGYIDRAMVRTAPQSEDFKHLPKEDRMELGRRFRFTIVPPDPILPGNERRSLDFYLIPYEDRN